MNTKQSDSGSYAQALYRLGEVLDALRGVQKQRDESERQLRIETDVQIQWDIRMGLRQLDLHELDLVRDFRSLLPELKKYIDDIDEVAFINWREGGESH